MARNKSREKQLPMKIEPNDEPMDVVPPVEEDLVKPDVGHFDETLLTCDVCLAIMHVPVNCSPCNHKFCASCIYRWLDDHYTCPKCRYLVKEVTKDLFASQICDEFLKHNPERARDEDTKDEQDRIELEYLEKLLERAKAKQNQYSGFALEDEEMDQMNPNEFEDQIRHFNTELFLQDAPRQNAGRIFRRLLLSISRRFREKEWEHRAKRLREKFNLPSPRPPTPPPEGANDADAPRSRVGGRHFNIMRFININNMMATDQDDSDSSQDEIVQQIQAANSRRDALTRGNAFMRMLAAGRRRTPQDDLLDMEFLGGSPPRGLAIQLQIPPGQENWRDRIVRNDPFGRNGRPSPPPSRAGRLQRQREERERRNQDQERSRLERAQARQQRAEARAGNNAPPPPPSRRRNTAPPHNTRSEPYNLRRRS